MTFVTRVDFFLAGLKAQCDEGGRRILLGDNTIGEAGMSRAIRFQCVGVSISNGLLSVQIQLTVRTHNSDWRRIFYK
jgi:hypothetical protein